MTRNELEKRIKELKAEREQFLASANMRIGEFNGRIAMLTELLNEMSPEPTPANGIPTALEYTYENGGRPSETQGKGALYEIEGAKTE